MWVTKDQKNSFLDWLEGYICSKHLSTKINGIMIRSLHMNLPGMILLIFCLGVDWMVGLIILFIACSVVSYITFNGCILSMLEHRLCQDDFTLIDPFLEYFSLEITNKNRNQISYLCIPIYLFIIACILYYRFF